MHKKKEVDKVKTIGNGLFTLTKKVGEGSFGQVFLAHETANETRTVAVKAESISCRFPQLIEEFKNSRLLKGHGFPELKHQGIIVEKDYIYMITELLGPTLEDLFNYCGRKLSLKTNVIVFSQIIERLEHMHGRGLIHRDVKPDNIMMGMYNKSGIVHMIDFGISRSYLNKETKKHIDFCTGKNLVGTARYVSINAHLGYELSRRDDLLTLGYVMIYFTAGALPW